MKRAVDACVVDEQPFFRHRSFVCADDAYRAVRNTVQLPFKTGINNRSDQQAKQ